MRIYTSYFAKINKLHKEHPECEPISICGKAPDWYHGLQFKKLAPKYSFFIEWKKNHDNEFYIKHFNLEVLSNLNALEIYNELSSMTTKESICLLCYEKPGDFCHRHLVAEWFKNNSIDCKELEL